MERVAELVNKGEHGQALVRLWVLGGQRAESTSLLNAWERARDARGFDRQKQEFGDALQRAEQFTVDRINGAPLAFITALDEVHALSHRAHRWIDEPFEEEGKRYWLIRNQLAHRPQGSFARQAGNREAWFRWHSIIPARTSHDIEVRVTAATGEAAIFLDQLVAAGAISLPVWIGHFQDDAKLQWQESTAKRFRLTGVDPAATRNDSIRDTLARAAHAGAHVVVLPEFTVDLEGRKLVAEWMRQANPDHPFGLFLAGSFHEKTPDGRFFNAAELWDRFAEPVLTHRKLRLFGAADGLAEDVNEGDQVAVLVSAIGRLSVLICKDFMDEHQSVATLLQEVPVDWILVPSYGDEKTIRGHGERAKKLAKLGPGTCSIVANQRNVELGGGDALPGFAVYGTEATRQDVDTAGSLVRIQALVHGPHDPSPPRERIRIIK